MEAIDLIKEQGLYRKVTEDYNPAIVIDLMEKYAVAKYHELTDNKVVVNGQNRTDKKALSLLDVSNNEVAVCNLHIMCDHYGKDCHLDCKDYEPIQTDC